MCLVLVKSMDRKVGCLWKFGVPHNELDGRTVKRQYAKLGGLELTDPRCLPQAEVTFPGAIARNLVSQKQQECYEY